MTPHQDDHDPVFRGDPPAGWWESWTVAMVAVIAAIIVLVGLAAFLFYVSVNPGN